MQVAVSHGQNHMGPHIPTRLLQTQSDQHLVGLAAAGHERAFEALVHRYHRPLLTYARHMSVAGASPEDALQQTFMHAWLALERGTVVNDVRPWLYRIVHNETLRLGRSAGVDHEQLTESLATGATPDEQYEQRSTARAALAGVAALPALQREAMLQTAIDGRRHEEVATTLGVSRAAVRGLVYRARVALRNALGALIPFPVARWMEGPLRSRGFATERLAEAGAGAGSVGIAGALAKGGAIAITTGALVIGGAALIPTRRDADTPAGNGGGARTVASRPPTPAESAAGVSPGPARSTSFVRLAATDASGDASSDRRALSALPWAVPHATAPTSRYQATGAGATTTIRPPVSNSPQTPAGSGARGADGTGAGSVTVGETGPATAPAGVPGSGADDDSTTTTTSTTPTIPTIPTIPTTPITSTTPTGGDAVDAGTSTTDTTTTPATAATTSAGGPAIGGE